MAYTHMAVTTVAWLDGWFMSMLHMINGRGSMDDAANVHNIVTDCGYDVSANRMNSACCGGLKPSACDGDHD